MINIYTLSKNDVQRIIYAFDYVESMSELNDDDRRIRDDFKREIK